jgi:excisionase family DNA binding protein
MTIPKLYTAVEVADLFQVSKITIHRLIRAGELQATRMHKQGRYRIYHDSLVDYAKRNNLQLELESLQQSEANPSA